MIKTMNRYSLTTKATNMDLFKQFLKQFKRKFPDDCNDADMIKYFFHLTLYDIHEGLNSKPLNICKIENFLQNTIDRYSNGREPTMISLKLWFYFNHVAMEQLRVSLVRDTIENKRREDMDKLMESILQYPETSNEMQLEEMFLQMQAFIVIAYDLGSPTDHVLLKHVREGISQVWEDNELQKYVKRKKYQRSSYLINLAGTIGGMLVLNSDDPDGEKEHVRNLLLEIETSKRTISESFDLVSKRTSELVKLGMDCIVNAIEIFVRDGYIRYWWPMEKLRAINQYVALFENYYYIIENMRDIYERTEYLVEAEIQKFKCVVDKVNELLSLRPIIGSECAFAHFSYIGSIWRVILVYATHLTEIIKVNKNFDELIYWEDGLEERFRDAVNHINLHVVKMKYPIDYTIENLFIEVKKVPPELNIIHPNLRGFLKNYCMFTLVLTKGFLTPATIYRKLCNNSSTLFGFAEADYAKFAERNVREFIEILKSVIFTNTDLVTLFSVVDHVMEHINVTPPEDNKLEKTNHDFGSQTEFMIQKDRTISRYSTKISWNVWDFHRETIRLANVRRCHTHSTQSNLTYGRRSAQNQTYYTRKHKGFQSQNKTIQSKTN